MRLKTCFAALQASPTWPAWESLIRSWANALRLTSWQIVKSGSERLLRSCARGWKSTKFHSLSSESTLFHGPVLEKFSVRGSAKRRTKRRRRVHGPPRHETADAETGPFPVGS